MPDYPTIPLPKRRMLPIPMFEDGSPVAPTRMNEPVIRGPQEQLVENVDRSVPQINIQSRMAAPQEDGPLPEAAPDRSGIQQHWPTIRAAQGEADQRALMEPGEQYRNYERIRDTQPVAEKGVKGRMKAALEGLQYGPLGAVVGAASPQTVRNARWRQRDIPEALQRAQVEEKEQTRQLAAGDKIADTTGVNPWTDQPTEQRRTRMENEATRKQAQASLDQSRQGMQTHRNRQDARLEKRDAAKAFNDLIRTAHGNLTDEQVQDAADTAGVDIPQGYNYRMHDLKPNAQGVFEAVDRATGLNTQGKQVTSFDATKLRAQQEHLRKMEQLGLMNAQTGQANASTNAASLQQRWEAMERSTIKSASQAEDKAAGYEEQASMMEGSKMPDGKPWPREAIEATRARAKNLGEQAQAMRNRQKGQADPRIGKTFKTKDGQRVRVTGVSTDGRPITVPVQ